MAHPQSKYIEELYNYKTMTRTVSKKDENGNIKTDENGNILTTEVPLEQNIVFSFIIDSVLCGERGTDKCKINGINSYVAYSPVTLKGDSESWGVITIISQKDVFSTLRKIIFTVICIGLTALVIAIFIVLMIAQSFTHPIRKIVPVIEELAEGNFTNRIEPSKSGNEIDSIILALNDVGKKMNRYIADLTHATAEKERLSTELNVATQIQAEMLPRVFPPYENHPEVELFASMEPAKEVGGDFYDFYMLDDDHFAVVVGDVSGKGVPAALFMVVTKTLLKDTAMHCQNPAEIFNSVNSVLCEGNDSGLFVTCWMGILTLSTGDFIFANAGHAAPVLYNSSTQELSFLVSKPNLMLAGMEGTKYKSYTTKLNSGDRLFIYTDGITEATDPQNNLYSEERLLSSLQNSKNLSSKEMINTVRKDITAFVKDAKQFDDITMLEMAYRK